jgi:aminoglycoside phosphotransferase (APT) family kinase protein
MSASTTGEPSSLQPPEIRSLLSPVGEVTEVAYFDGGTFARVARVTLADGREVAVKSGPRAAGTERLLAHETEVIKAEAEVLGLAQSHPGLRLPRLVLCDLTRSVVDVDVLVTEVVAGRPWNECADAMSAESSQRSEHQRGTILAPYAALTGDRFGFVSDRAPAYSAPDWFTTFRAMVQGLADDAARFGVDARTGEFLALVERHRPALEQVGEPRLVHGDLWAGNLLVEPGSGEATGVIDPERALWGDPRFDIAAALQGTTSGIPDALHAGYGADGGALDLSAGGRFRLDLYLLWFATCMLVESPSRGLSAAATREREEWLAPQLSHLHGALG